MRGTLIAVVLLALSGSLHGLWSHRWEQWSASAAQASAERLERIPLQVGDWRGERIKTDDVTLTEDVIGRSASAQYTNRIDGSVVMVYLACGPTDGLVSHTPRVCYPANGYTCPRSDVRVSVPAAGDAKAAEFWVSNFTSPDAAAPIHLRVFWAWSDGTGWQVPTNPLRAFRNSSVIHKCYAVRQLMTPNEPLDGDPALRLLADLLPPLDATLAAER